MSNKAFIIQHFADKVGLPSLPHTGLLGWWRDAPFMHRETGHSERLIESDLLMMVKCTLPSPVLAQVSGYRDFQSSGSCLGILSMGCEMLPQNRESHRTVIMCPLSGPPYELDDYCWPVAHRELALLLLIAYICPALNLCWMVMLYL